MVSYSGPDYSGFDYSGPDSPGSLPSDSISPVVYDNAPGETVFYNGPGLGGYSVADTDPNSVGGILNGLASVSSSILSGIGKLNSPGTLPRPTYRLGAASPLGTVAGGLSLPLLALLGVGGWLLFKRKKG